MHHRVSNYLNAHFHLPVEVFQFTHKQVATEWTPDCPMELKKIDRYLLLYIVLYLQVLQFIFHIFKFSISSSFSILYIFSGFV